MLQNALAISAPAALLLQLLQWLAASPRTYAETMEAWRTSCPRLPVWEDAVDLGYIDVTLVAGGPTGLRWVSVSARGRAAIAAGLPD